MTLREWLKEVKEPIESIEISWNLFENYEEIPVLNYGPGPILEWSCLDKVFDTKFGYEETRNYPYVTIWTKGFIYSEAEYDQEVYLSKIHRNPVTDRI